MNGLQAAASSSPPYYSYEELQACWVFSAWQIAHFTRTQSHSTRMSRGSNPVQNSNNVVWSWPGCFSRLRDLQSFDKKMKIGSEKIYGFDLFEAHFCHEKNETVATLELFSFVGSNFGLRFGKKWRPRLWWKRPNSGTFFESLNAELESVLSQWCTPGK